MLTIVQQLAKLTCWRVAMENCHLQGRQPLCASRIHKLCSLAWLGLQKALELGYGASLSSAAQRLALAVCKQGKEAVNKALHICSWTPQPKIRLPHTE